MYIKPPGKPVNEFQKVKITINENQKNAIFFYLFQCKCDELMNFVTFTQCDNFLQYESFMMILVQHYKQGFKK